MRRVFQSYEDPCASDSGPPWNHAPEMGKATHLPSPAGLARFKQPWAGQGLFFAPLQTGNWTKPMDLRDGVKMNVAWDLNSIQPLVKWLQGARSSKL